MPNTTLETVADYVADARVLLLDTTRPYRYDYSSLLMALNVTLLETRRVRPDLFVFEHHERVQQFTAVNTAPVRMEQPFRLALVYGMCAHAFARDQEDVQDTRAAAFMRMFHELLLGMRVPGDRQAGAG